MIENINKKSLLMDENKFKEDIFIFIFIFIFIWKYK